MQIKPAKYLLNQKGALPLLLLIAAAGLVTLLLIANTVPFKDRLYNLLFPKPTSRAATTGFLETFDGKPTTPIPWNSSRFNISAESQDGSIDDANHIPSAPHPLIAGHGPGCEAPIHQALDPGSPNLDPALNNHAIDITQSTGELDYQQNYKPQTVYQCNDHMMSIVHAGYALTSFTPRYIFDFSDGDGLLQLDTNLYSFTREWWDMYIAPPDEMLSEVIGPAEGHAAEDYPQRAIKIQYRGQSMRVFLIDNYQEIMSWSAGQQLNTVSGFTTDPAFNTPRLRRTFRFNITPTGFSYSVQKTDGTFKTFSSTWRDSRASNAPFTLTFNKALVQLEHHAYNPTKDGINADPWSQFTFHWDNLYFDGPANPAMTAFEPPAHYLKVTGPNQNTTGGQVTINIPSSLTQANLVNPILTGLANSLAQNNTVDPGNLQHWRQFRVNNGPWTDLTLRKNRAKESGNERGWSTIAQSLTVGTSPGQVRPGDNVFEFRMPLVPSGSSQSSYEIRDLELQVNPIASLVQPGILPGIIIPTGILALSGQSPTPTPTPTSTSIPTPTPPSFTQNSTSLTLSGNSYAQAPHAAELNPTGDWTIESWFKDQNSAGNYNHDGSYILSKGDPNTVGETPYFMYIGFRRLYAGVRTGWTNSTVSYSLPSSVAFNAWHHAAASFQSSTRTITLYLDGTQIAQGTVPAASSGNSTPVSIGRNGNTGQYFRGVVDDVRIWNVARTYQQLADNYSKEFSSAPAGLVGNWKFDEASGTTAVDATATQQNATLSGASYSTDNPTGSTQASTTTPTSSPIQSSPTATPVLASGAPSQSSCTLFIGYSQTNNWFGVARQVMGDKFEMLWSGGGAAHLWADPNYSGWSNNISYPCTQNSQTPDRLVLDVTHDSYLTQSSAVSDMAAIIRNEIATARSKYPSARVIILQPVAGGPNHTICPPGAGSSGVRASYNHPSIHQAIDQVVNGSDILRGYDSQVSSCSDYADNIGHLNISGQSFLGNGVGNYYRNLP